ncbi:hypothetical protein POX_f08343 [Penicillium oxalicum]|uniref:hypothetical protein n=1 Tax=Penicillium oxalicum TaxID=69781 RepID=UPI0020B7C465|nr:hypothetical protein POX_f08343 [Penicillium oxalicum]KAI2787961.1 hypothetical protein POX_f08343 [Penicillium oxalicum]
MSLGSPTTSVILPALPGSSAGIRARVRKPGTWVDARVDLQLRVPARSVGITVARVCMTTQ